jgi:hypothetical protein
MSVSSGEPVLPLRDIVGVVGQRVTSQVGLDFDAFGVSACGCFGDERLTWRTTGTEQAL